MTDIDIPITAVRLGQAEEDLVLEVLRSGMLAQGQKVARLESLFQELTGAAHAVAVNNGTTALVAALQSLELAPGDEVVTSPFTFVATVNAILEAGATVRFADIGLDDFNVDPGAIEARCNGRTRVLMPVHLYGQAADMASIEDLGRRLDLVIVEDAAQAHGASWGGRPVGRSGLACFSLYATKNISTGEGGMVTTDDERLADRLRLLRNQGMRARYQYEIAGHNYRMTDLQAAVGIPQMERIDEVVAARQRNAAALGEGLADLDGLVTPSVLSDRFHVWHQYTVRVTEDAPVGRDELAERLAQLGVGSGVYYPKAVYDYDCYRDHPRVILDEAPNAEQAAREVLSLPVHPYLDADAVARVVDAVRSIFGR